MIIGIDAGSTKVHRGAVREYYIGKVCNQDNNVSVTLQEKPGRYTLFFQIKTGEKSNLGIVYQNGQETGAFAVPYTGNIDCFGRYRPIKDQYPVKDREKAAEILVRNREMTRELGEAYLFGVPCVIRGEEEICLTAAGSCLNEGMKTYNGEGFFVEKAYLVKGIAAPESFYHKERPGKNMVDLWGWMSMTSFEHPGERVTPYEELVRRGVLEAYAWGANNFEFLPINADGVALDLPDEPWEGKGKYRHSRNNIWNAKRVGELMQLAQEHGMLTEFFLYCLHGAGFIAEEMLFEEKINLFEQIVKGYSNCLEAEQGSLVDGIITEAWFPIEAERYVEKAWKWNPGFFHLVSHNDGSQYEMRSMGYTPATHAYNAHWPGFDTQHTGYDYEYPLLPYPTEFYTQKEGIFYTYMQGCGQTEHPRKKYPRIPDIPFGITNRTVSPDWIIAQAHNYALRNLLEENVHPAMALCWEADEQTMCPAEARQYVYAASQDPIRLAACYPLGDTGAGGEIELKRVTRKFQPWDTARLRKRSIYPADCIVLGNRYLQMIAFPGRDENILHCDLSETAAFYGNGAVVVPAFPFIVTRFQDNRFLEKEMEITEAAGPLAVLTEKTTMGSGFVTFRQLVRYEVYSELPEINICIRRSMEPGQKEEITTVLGFGDYTDCVLMDGCAVLEDERGILPGAFICVEGENHRLTWQREYGLFLTEELSGAQELRIHVFLQMGDYRNADLEQVQELFQRKLPEIRFTEEVKVKNETQLPLPVIVKIKEAKPEPCYVWENGYWQHRGITFLQESPGSALVKLYLKPGETGKIKPYGYLEGALRPGRGCQNTVAFQKITEIQEGAVKAEKGIEAELLVEADNPMLHAVIVETAKEIAEVWLDGRKYRYFNGRQIFLPQGREHHKLKVIWGTRSGPILRVTYGRIRRCEFCQDTGLLQIEWEHQPWVKEEWKGHYQAVIHSGGLPLCEISGGKILQQAGERLLLELTDKKVQLQFINTL